MARPDTRRPRRRRKWTEATVVDALRAFFAAVPAAAAGPGEVPSVERDNPPLLGGARRVFGTLEAAIRAAGLPYPPRPPSPWTRETLVAEIPRRHAVGHDLSLSAVKDRRQSPEGAAAR